MTKYHLKSVPMVHTPGLVRAAIETNKTDLVYWVRVFHEGYGLPIDAATALVMGETNYTVSDDGTVSFEHGEPS